jgi:hypothetical protein
MLLLISLGKSHHFFHRRTELRSIRSTKELLVRLPSSGVSATETGLALLGRLRSSLPDVALGGGEALPRVETGFMRLLPRATAGGGEALPGVETGFTRLLARATAGGGEALLGAVEVFAGLGLRAAFGGADPRFLASPLVPLFLEISTFGFFR